MLCILGEPGRELIFGYVDRVWVCYNSLADRLLHVHCLGKWSLGIISLNLHSKLSGSDTALIPTLQFVSCGAVAGPKNNWKWKAKSSTGDLVFQGTFWFFFSAQLFPPIWFPWKQDFCSTTSASLILTHTPDNLTHAHGFGYALCRFISSSS